MSLLSVQEVAKELNVHASWIYGKIHSKSLPFPFVRIGLYLRFRKSDIEQYIEDQIDQNQPNKKGGR
ncbi:helix-turn-helix domain-containing protein [Acidobacteria bacterium AH-259-L09]|nr:helix-turn-helix domain-containing protein [Acidobacteria bacterium AH-259-L09]